MQIQSWGRFAAPTLYILAESGSELFDLPTKLIVGILVEPLVLGLGLQNQQLAAPLRYL